MYVYTIRCTRPCLTWWKTLARERVTDAKFAVKTPNLRGRPANRTRSNQGLLQLPRLLLLAEPLRQYTTAPSWPAIMGARVMFYPTLGFNVFMKNVSSRRWYDRIDSTVILGALPLRSKNIAQELVENENVQGVIAMNEDYELKRFVTTEEEWTKLGVDSLQLPTVDFTEAPSIDKLEQGVKFIMEHAAKDKCVYVHCKAGRTRSATLVGCYLMHVNKWTPQEAQVYIQTKRQHIIMKDKHFRAMYRYYDKHVKGQRSGKTLDMSPG